MKRTTILYALCGFCAAFVATAAAGQTYFSGNEWKTPGIYSVGAAPLRTEFISFDTREQAEKNNAEKSPHYLSLELQNQPSSFSYTATADIPYMWLDREVFLRVEGLEAYYVQINDRTIGFASDDIVPTDFNISEWIVDGENKLTFKAHPLPIQSVLASSKDGIISSKTSVPKLGYAGYRPEIKAYIYSQPKLRIENYSITTRIDSTKTHCILRAEVMLANSYNSRETFRLGYDLYMPNGGKLIHYDLRDVTLAGNSRDTVVFEQPIYDGVMNNLWSAETPKLYSMMLHINYDQRWIEYLPVKVGFGETTFADGTILRNGKPVNVKAVTYSQHDKTLTLGHLRALKKAGYNTILPVAPSPIWFYDMCESTGMYVIERANIYSDRENGDREAGGAMSNDPAFLGSYLGRTEAMYSRVKDRPCIIAWSLGGRVGNGYNMYKTYQWLKAQTTLPVIFDDADGEWNTDAYFPYEEGGDILTRLGQKLPERKRWQVTNLPDDN